MLIVYKEWWFQLCLGRLLCDNECDLLMQFHCEVLLLTHYVVQGGHQNEDAKSRAYVFHFDNP